MKLQELLKQDLTALKPGAIVIVNDQGDSTAQTVAYQPEILNLGAVLLGYYFNLNKVRQLRNLGNCLSVGHYVQAPRALKYGLDFADRPDFQKLPGKAQKHLTGELQDCTIAYSRDLKSDQPSVKVSDLRKYLEAHPAVKFVYRYQDHTWQVLRDAGKPLNHPVDLGKLISRQLKKA